MSRYKIIAFERGNEENRQEVDADPIGVFPGVVTFFRSEDQADGKLDADNDTAYSKEFGFDFYRRDLYGLNNEKEYNKRQGLSYKKELIKNNGDIVKYHLYRKEFVFKKTTHTNGMGIDEYHIPWIFVAPKSTGAEKTITIQAKILHIAKELNYKAYKKGLSEDTEEIFFSIVPTDDNYKISWEDGNEHILKKHDGSDICIATEFHPFEIGTDLEGELVPLSLTIKKVINTNYALVAYYKRGDLEYPIGQLNFWNYKINKNDQKTLDDNKIEYNHNAPIPLKIIELRIKLNTTTFTNSTIVRDLQKELDFFRKQAGIKINVENTIGRMTIDPNHTDLSKRFNTHNKLILKTGSNSVYELNENETLPNFHYELAKKIFFSKQTVIETFFNNVYKRAFKQETVPDDSGAFITFWELLNNRSIRFIDEIIEELVDYLTQSMILCFVSPDIESTQTITTTSTQILTHTRSLGIGVLGKGISIISKNGKEDYAYTYVHEIAHNLNLSHTFDERDTAGNLIKCNFKGLIEKQTKENVMDYNIKANSIIKKQWKIVNQNKVQWTLNKEQILKNISEKLDRVISNYTPIQFTENKEDQIKSDFKEALQHHLGSLLQNNTFTYVANTSKFLLEPENTRLG